MGRPERPVDPEAGPIQQLAHDLRALRQEAGGPTYHAMARQVGVSLSSLSRAAAGEKLPSLAVTLAYVRACGGDEAMWEVRWKAVADAAAEPVPAPSREPHVMADEEPPYRGLTRFEARDRELFFGRDHLLRDLRTVVCEHRFAAVFGASGSGKSSLLRAGLVPRLQEHARELGRPAVVRILVPGARPAETFRHLLTPGEGDPDSWVIVDQFEEIFTVCRDEEERARFIELLLSARDAGTRLRVVIAMRADFYGECARYPELAEALRHNGLLVGPMTAGELREAVTGPATAAGLVAERRLTARIVEDVLGEPGGLPMLSHALLETWRRRRGRILTLEAYEAVGGVHGAIAATAEGVYERLTPDQARTARRLLLRLISLGEGTADTRRAVERSELDEWLDPEISAVLEVLGAARLVSIDGETVDLAHEALIGSWPRLREWIEQDRDRLRQHRLLAEATRTWRQLECDPGALYRGTRLDQAAEAFAQPDRARELIASEHAFLTASLSARDVEVRSAAHARRRRTSVRATLSVLLALMLGVSVVAWQQNRADAHDNAEGAAWRVAVVADSLRTMDPRTAMLLSAAAWGIAQTPETQAALLASVGQPEQDAFTDPAQNAGAQRLLLDSGRTLLSVDGRAWRAWSTVTHRQLSSGSLPSPVLNPLTASPDSQLIALQTSSGWRLWDLAAHRWTGTPQAASTEELPVFLADPHSYLVVNLNTDHVERFSTSGRPEPLDASVSRKQNVATSPDGHLTAVCPDSGPLVVHSSDTGRDVPGDWTGSGGAHCSGTNSTLRFSADGHRLAAVSASGVDVWDMSTGKLLANLPYANAQSVVFSPDGTFLAAAATGEIAVWRLSAPDSPVFRESLDNERLAGDITWDPSEPVLRYLEGSTVHTIDLGAAAASSWHASPAHAAVLSTDGRLLATAERSGNSYTFQLTNVADGHVLRTLPAMSLPVPDDAAGTISAQDTSPLIAFSPDSASLAYGLVAPGRASENQPIDIWNVTNGRMRATLDLGPSSATTGVDAIALGPGAATLVATRTQQSVDAATGEVWDVARDHLSSRLGALGNNVLAIRPDGRFLVGDNAVAALPSGARQGRTLSLGEQIDAVAFNADGSEVAVGDASGRVALWNGDLTRELGVLPSTFPAPAAGAEPEAVSALTFSSDGSVLAVGGAAGSLQLWDTASHQHLGGNLTTPGERIIALSFSPDGSTLHVSSPHVPLQDYDVTPAHALSSICARTGGSLTPALWSMYIPDLPYHSDC